MPNPLPDPVADPIVLDTPDPAPAPIPRRASRVVCEFCGCALTPEGEVMKRGEAARKFQRLEQELEDTRASVEHLERERDTLRADCADLKRLTARKPLIPIY